MDRETSVLPALGLIPADQATALLAERQRDPVSMFRHVRESFHALRVRWDDLQGRPTAEDLICAAGMWLGYPLAYDSIEAQAIMIFRDQWKGRAEPYKAISSLQGAHTAASRVLIEAGEYLGMDASAIAPAAEICQDIFHRHGYKFRRGNRYDTWPTCLGSFDLELPPDYRTAIRAGHAAFERLMIRAKISNDTLSEWIPEFTMRLGLDRQIGHETERDTSFTTDENSTDRNGPSGPSTQKVRRRSRPKSLDKHARECIQRFREYKRTGDPQSMKAVAETYVSENPGVKFPILYKRLTDNSPHWE